MDMTEEYEVVKIVERIVKDNTDKSLGEIKRMVKEKLRRKDQTKGKQDLEGKIAPKVGTEEIIEIITTKGLLRKDENMQGEDREEER